MAGSSGFLTLYFPLRGVTDPNPGFQAILPVAGPMGRSVADLERMARVLFGESGGSQAYFPAPIPYRDVTLPKKLRFGYYLNGASFAALDCALLTCIYTLKNRRIGQGVSCLP